MDDKLIIECINNSGYYEYQDVNLDDLPNDKRIAIILAGEILALRPDLKNLDSSELCYVRERILENGEKSFSLPTRNLFNFLKEPPFEDSSIYTYSIKDEKLLKKIYKGTGTDWERVK